MTGIRLTLNLFLCFSVFSVYYVLICLSEFFLFSLYGKTFDVPKAILVTGFTPPTYSLAATFRETTRAALSLKEI